MGHYKIADIVQLYRRVDLWGCVCESVRVCVIERHPPQNAAHTADRRNTVRLPWRSKMRPNATKRSSKVGCTGQSRERVWNQVERHHRLWRAQASGRGRRRRGKFDSIANVIELKLWFSLFQNICMWYVMIKLVNKIIESPGTVLRTWGCHHQIIPYLASNAGHKRSELLSILRPSPSSSSRYRSISVRSSQIMNAARIIILIYFSLWSAKHMTGCFY